jgi:hypothetical protein
MGGKTSKSTQTISIPPEVLARYNAINARADTVTNKPYQYYTGQFVAPLTATQQAGISNTNAAANMAQPYYGAATSALAGAQNAAVPYYQGATDQLNQGINAGNQYAGQSSATINAAQSQGAGIQQNALNNLGAAYSSAQPYNQTAGGQYQQGLDEGRGLTAFSSYGTQEALDAARPYQQTATDYMGRGAQAVNPYDLGADQINKYMSPYLQNVLQGTAGLLNQQNQQQQAGQMGNAIRSGAFGGDRSGIAAANLNQQQNLANSKIFSDILNQGYGQALSTAQQQQGLSFEAAQANRAAQQQAVQQALNIGQQGFGQGLAAAQQQGALGQQVFNMGSTAGQNTAALGNQIYNQGTNTATQQSNVGNTLFNQGATTAAQQAALGAQQFGQGVTASQQGAALGQGIYGMGSSTSQQLADLGQGAQGSALAGAAAQLTAGGVEQATKQAEDTAKYNEFLQAQSLPYQQLKLAADIAEGTGTASGSTTTTAQPGGFFSDERLKENIKAVGKTFDGQTIHSYNYKGDPRTQIGLIAQEVQKHHPDAVGLAGGYKTVDYDKATEDAADRGHMANGGYASMGGGVMPQHAGQGFAGGGVAGFDPAVMQQILAAQQAMYENIGKGGMYAGGPNAGGGLVPQSEVVARQLMTPAELSKQATGAEQAKSMVDLGNSINQFGEGVGAWGNHPQKKDQTPPPPPENTKGTFQESLYRDPDYEDDYQGGLFHRALGGGTPYNGQGLEIPEEDASSGSSSQRQLATASGSIGKPESGLDKLGKVAKIAGTVASIFSDKRMKENIKPIGKLFDGQIVHSYNYKGDPRTQIGLIAQEVEHHKPHAVGEVHGMKAVDYDKATASAAHRGHFAMGGEPMGGGLAGGEQDSQEPDFNLDPEDILSGGDEDAEFFMRQAMNKPETPAEAAGLGALQSNKEKILDAYKTTPAFKPRFRSPTGLSPSFSGAGLPSDLAGIGKLIYAAEGDGTVPTSSAMGRYGITSGTYVNYFKKAFPQQARQLGENGILALRSTPEGRRINNQLGPMIIADNAKYLSQSGFEPNAANVYLAHFLGPAGAKRLLSANPETPIQQAVSRDALVANPDVFKKVRTAGDLVNFMGSTLSKRAKEIGRGRFGEGGTAETDEQFTPVPADKAGGLLGDDANKEGLAAGEATTTTPTATTTDTQDATGVAPPVDDIVVNAKPDPRGKPQYAPRQNIYGRGKQDPISYEGGNIPSYRYDYATEPFFKGIKRGSAGSIIPLLTGIAAMGTAPTRSLGVALATGLGAGAQSYQNLAIERNKQLPQRQVAESKWADSVRAYFEREFVPLGQGKWYYHGKVVDQSDRDQMYSDAIAGRGESFFPKTPETAKSYEYAKPPEPPKPVAIADRPDMTTPAGILAGAYNDPVVVDARNREAGLKADIARDRQLQGDPQMQSNPNALQTVGNRISTAETQLAEAIGAKNKRVEELTGVPLANLGETQRLAYEDTMAKASKLEGQLSEMRPIMQQIRALDNEFRGGTGQSAWAKVTDFVRQFGNLTDEQKNLIGSGADANSRQKLMETIGGPLFDPSNPGPALRWVRDNYINPRYLDLKSQVKSIRPFATPTGAPQPSVGVSPGITTPPARRPDSQPGGATQKGPDGVWRGQTLQDIQNDKRIPKGAPIEYRGANGQIVEGVK